MRRRKQFIIDADFQYKTIRRFLIFIVFILAVALLSFALVYHYYGEVLVDGVEPLYYASDRVLDVLNDQYTVFDIFWPILGLTTLGVVAVSVFFGVLISHRLAGPIYRIRAELRAMADGNLHREVRLRKNDEFKGLADDLNLLSENIRGAILRIRQIAQDESLDSEKRIQRIREILSEYRLQ